MACDYQELLDDSACFLAIPIPILEVIQAQLLCQISDATGNIGLLITHGDPNGVLTASPPSLAYDPDTGTLYIKRTGTGTNTGWQELIA